MVEAADTRILAGSTLKLGTGALGGGLNTPTILNEGAIVADFTDGVTLSADISGSGTLSKAGTGKLILSGNNSYAGGTTVTGGTLSMTNGNAVGTGLITLGGGTTLQLDGPLPWRTASASRASPSSTWPPAIPPPQRRQCNALASPAPPGALEKTGTGTLVLSGVNTYSGGTVIYAGILRATNAGASARRRDAQRRHVPGRRQHAQFRNAFTLNSAGGMIDTNGFAMTITGNIPTAPGPVPDQDRRRHPHARGHQHLFRRHDGQCRHAGGRCSTNVCAHRAPYVQRRHAATSRASPEHRLATPAPAPSTPAATPSRCSG